SEHDGQISLNNFINITEDLLDRCRKAIEKAEKAEKADRCVELNILADRFKIVYKSLTELDNAQGDSAINIYKAIDLQMSYSAEDRSGGLAWKELQSAWEKLKLPSDQGGPASTQDTTQHHPQQDS